MSLSNLLLFWIEVDVTGQLIKRHMLLTLFHKVSLVKLSLSMIVLYVIFRECFVQVIFIK